MRRFVPMLLATLAMVVAGCEKKAQPAPTGTDTSKQAEQGQGGTAPATPPAANPTPPPAGDGTLLLGVATSLTGGQATFGISTRNGIELAVKEANEAGGVKGKKVTTRVYDTQGKPEE